MEKDSTYQDYEAFLLLTEGAEAELVEKKSRFIATVAPWQARRKRKHSLRR